MTDDRFTIPADATPLADEVCTSSSTNMPIDRYGCCSTCGFPSNCHEY